MEADMSRAAHGVPRSKTHANVIIAQVDFRLAPEYPIPTQVNDCFDAYKWCYVNASKLGGDPKRFFSIGSSLGGTAAVGVALKLIDENLGHMVSGIAVLCPALLHPECVPDEYIAMFKSYEENWTCAPLQDGQSMMLFYGHNNGTIQRANPYAFPCLHPGIPRLPPVYQAICEADPVRDDSTVFRHQLDKCGIRNHFHTYPGMPHYFWLFPQLPSSEMFHRNVVEGVKWVLSQME
ncbi:uncharacterized protein ATNIH1004_005734 [Aspergillus tanneri]|uniref:Alpha/beta hydrolase fold-3 domain-containing protein n=1 Tax=Aspergillus tanneri TaxID=1220188 RepID=A0A5M9MJ62_9EURO|nr:uncharacterized protein ATNIH1004_005734 [Aspergillus tanneri]KAA8647051.1 hypothetical protein ATNIH1004_005734 [Aspergillus tanneri]